MAKINESQTQVYMNGGVIPQQRDNNLTNLTAEFFKSGKSDAQVLAILCGMGVPQPWAEKAVSEYAKLKGVTENSTKQKNDIKMQFTLTELYERVTDTLNKLKEMKSADNGRVSFSADNAIKVLESTLNKFPVSLKTADLTEITEEIEKSSSPTLKYSIAKELHKGSGMYNWMSPIQEMLGYIESMYSNNTLNFQVSEACNTAARKGGKLYEKLSKDLTNALTESNVKNAFLAVSAKHPWSPECKSILESIAREDQVVAEQKGGKLVKTFSPILSEGDNHTFHLMGKNYTTNGKTISESNVTDARFLGLVEALKLCVNEGDTFNIYGQKDNVLTINLTEGTVKIGEIDLSNASVIEIKEALLGTNFFNYRDNYKMDTVCHLIEHFDMVTEMDDVLSVNSLVWPALYLTMIAVEEGVYMNKFNGGIKMNEMKFYPSAGDAVKVAKEFIGYDVSMYVAEKLEAEGNKEIKLTVERKKIEEMIEFLENKKSEITSAISRVGETGELKEALGMVNSEITLKEKELQSTFITEKKSKSYYLNNGYVEGKLASDIEGMKKGMDVMVNAEEYASLGDEELIDVVDPKSDKSTYVRKDALSVSL